MSCRKVKDLYVDVPGLGLGFIRRIDKQGAKIGIVDTGEYLQVPVDEAKKACIPQTITIDQIGAVKLYDYIKVRTKSESYVLQLLKIPGQEEEVGCTFAKYWRDPYNNHCRNGILVLDNNSICTADTSVMKLRRLTCLPGWMGGHPTNPVMKFKAKRSKILST